MERVNRLTVADAPKGRSIWNDVGQMTFEQAVRSLSEKLGYVPLPYALPQSKWPGQSGDYTISFGTEQRLANGIEFLTAYNVGASSVTACAVQELEGSLVVRVAANEGLDSEAATTLRKVLRTVSQCAAKGSLPQFKRSYVFTLIPTNRNTP